ncbi:MAG TPA: hypothetical protein PK640_05035 [Verrucomicrobiota bacterium]|nr:hypothetical protein [Verrucomicrobiota bacterium]
MSSWPADAKLPTNRWSHVAGVFDARTGEKKLYLDGQMVASGQTQPPTAPEHEIVTRGYTLQRFLQACAGHGALPIKFNGSLFTVEVPGQFEPDYRQWGGCYWFQNTRLPYWPMLASGDFDLVQPCGRITGERPSAELAWRSRPRGSPGAGAPPGR